MERRFLSISVRTAPATDSNSPGTLVGYSAVYNSYSADLGGFRELVLPGCFDRSLANGDDVKALVNHDSSLIIGRTRNKTLRLSSDNIGLRCEIDLPNTSVGRDAWENVRTGNQNEMSFAFEVQDQDWGEDDDPDDRSKKITVRRLKQVKLYDCSVVTSPAYSATSVSVSGKHPFFNSLVRSFQELFPTGVPVEVRSRVPQLRDVTKGTSTERDRRQKMTSLVLGL